MWGRRVPSCFQPHPRERNCWRSREKQGTIYEVDRNNLGKNCGKLSPPCTNSDTQIAQELRQATPGVLSSPLYWNGRVYWPSFDFLYSWSVDPASGLISTLPTSRSAQQFARTAGASLSANGASNGIVWIMHNTGELFAFDATDLTKVLWTSGQAPNNRDGAGSATKFAPPTIVNGKVYVGTSNSVVAYGQLNATATTPTFSPRSGTYSGPQSVTITDATPGATIYYTANGTTPTTGSTKYTGPVTVSASETLRAIAVANGLNNSAGSCRHLYHQFRHRRRTDSGADFHADGRDLHGPAICGDH